MHRWAKSVFFLVFAITGFSALTLQVVWQRVISLHAGVDLVSFTTVVSAFLAGIGIGSLLGGWLADRLGPRRSVSAFALSNLVIGLFAATSIWLFYDVYQREAASLTTTFSKFLFNFALLLVPTTLMGLSLPLVAKGLVERIGDAGSLVGRLYSVNTIGAAVGAAVAGWKLLGTYGFVTTTRIAGALNVIAAVLVLIVYRSLSAAGQVAAVTADTGDEGEPVPDDAPREGAPAGTAPDVVGARAVWPWYVVYGLTGAVALGFEVVFFRMIDTIMRSNSYSFAHVLSVYLLLFGVGAAIASPIVKRAKRPDQWFLWLQFGVGLTALGGLIMLTKGLLHTPWADDVRQYFLSEGYNVGFRNIDGSEHTDFLQVFFGAPLLIMGLPVLCMGASFPFVQSLVAQRMESLGRRTGMLLFVNVVGNVVGTLFVGFVVIDRWGTSGTYKLLALSLLVPALGAAYLARGSVMKRASLAVAALLVMALFVRFVPTNQYLYSYLHGVEMDHLYLQEDRSCADALKVDGTGYEEMTINGSSQNGYPFDDYHIALGLTPALMHRDPNRVMALGLGIGATPYGLSLDQRVDRVDAVEICGPQVPLLQDLGERRSTELHHFFHDPKVDVAVGDGRDFLLRSPSTFDVIVVDTLRQQSAYSGNLYSKEFYELVRDRLSSDGMLAQWAPTPRTMNSVLEVFPYVVVFNVATYQNSPFFVASMHPISFDRNSVLERYRTIDPSSGLTPERADSVRKFYESVVPSCVIDPAHIQPVTDDVLLNHDLMPRDEYFLNQPPQADARSTCAGPGG